MCRQTLVRFYDCNHVATSYLKHCAALCSDESGSLHAASQCPYDGLSVETEYINKPFSSSYPSPVDSSSDSDSEELQVCELCGRLPRAAKLGQGVGIWLKAAGMVVQGAEDSGFTTNKYGEVQRWVDGEDVYLVGGRIPYNNEVNRFPDIKTKTVQEVAKLIAEFVRKYAVELREPNTYVGGWVDAEGALYLDVSNRAKDRVKAQLLSIFREEIALYAAHSGKIIRNLELERRIRETAGLMETTERVKVDKGLEENLKVLEEEAREKKRLIRCEKRKRSESVDVSCPVVRERSKSVLSGAGGVAAKGVSAVNGKRKSVAFIFDKLS
ncbi:MAG: hypothetical protein MMC23_002488 [Stictis urceolatum]|nr:hypothetical protein [Stictis urceolata]